MISADRGAIADVIQLLRRAANDAEAESGSGSEHLRLMAEVIELTPRTLDDIKTAIERYLGAANS